MNDLRRHFRRFLNSEIPDRERERMNETYRLDLVPGDTFMDALAVRAVQLAESSERWAELARQLEQIRGGGDG